MASELLDKELNSTSDDKQLPTPPPESSDVSASASGAGSSTSPIKTTSNEGSGAESTKAASKDVGSTGKREAANESKSIEDENGNKSSDKTTGGKTEDKKDDTESQKADEQSTKSDDKSEDKSKDSEEKDEKKTEEKKKALPRGMKADIKNLWAKTDAQCKCCTQWSETNDADDKNIEESDECLQHAIVVRRKRKHEGNRKPLKVDSIVVHSPLIKKVLQKVFSGYPDLVVDLDELIFDAPFAPFFFRWTPFKEACESQEDEMTKSHLKLLYDALEKELEKPIQRQKDLLRHKAIDFELLWTLYTPGALMYSHDDGHDRLYETSDCEYWQDLSGMKFTVRCEMIDWDGDKFGKMTLSETMNKFKGTRAITSLPSYPLVFHPKAEEVKRKCIERGKRFQELAGVHCKDYKGTAVEYSKYAFQTIKNKRHLEGRVVLDEELFAKFNPDESHSLRDLGEDADELKKSEVEALTRLGEQADKAKEALKKSLEEQKKKEEEEKKKKEEEEAKKKKEQEEGKEKEKPKQDNKVDSEVTEKSSEQKVVSEKQENGEAHSSTKEPDSTANSISEKATSDDVKEGEAEATNTADGKADSEKEAGKDSEAASDLVDVATKTDEQASSSTDSEGVPTPTTETEEDVQDPKSYSNEEKQELEDDQLAICSSWLRGYSLTYQKWASFSIEHISNVIWNDDAFKELTLPAEYRELILATIQSQIRQNQWKQKMEKVDKEQKPISSLKKDAEVADDGDEDPAQFDDFIAQKGLGYIMLFSGNPGVGKTATAESIAELLHVPLCIMSVGNLGTTAESVESALQDILELASKWNAVLLLDEADIFLEQRTKHDLHRNAVVSVFLRLLEYYQGVLCLTTNRSEEIDVAFHSRIHISLPFPDLTENNREQIWRHFAKITNKKHETSLAKRKAAVDKKAAVAKATAPEATRDSEAKVIDTEEAATTNGTKTTESPIPEPIQDEHHNDLIDLSTSDFRKLSQTPLNGRQIKNAFKTAVLLASYKKEKVQLKHVKTALKTIDGNGLGKREVGRMYY